MTESMMSVAQRFMSKVRRREGTRGAVAHNVIWNWAGMGVNMLTGFIAAPYLVHHLGDTTYGLWILIASLTGYFGLLDLGVRGSVGRYIAFYRARNDPDGVNQILNTAFVILCGVAVVALAATLCVMLGFFHVFSVPPEQLASTRLALLIVGLNLAVTFPVTVFDGMLWGSERFDVLNAVDIPATLVRTGVTIALVSRGYGLVALALITFLVTGATAVAKAAAAIRLTHMLRLGISHVRRSAARQLYGYGVWHFLLSVSQQVNSQVGPILIGAMLTVGLVTPYSIAARLIGYASACVVACTGVLTPVSTALHAQEKHDKQRWLFVTGGKYCTAFSLFFVTLFAFLGGPLIALWMGPKMAGAALLLTILAAGEALSMSQWLTFSMVLGMAKHPLSAVMGFVETAVTITLAVALERTHGLIGVCAGFAIARLTCNGIYQVVYGCNLVGIPIRKYVVQSLLPAVAAAVLPAAALAAVVRWNPPTRWPVFLAWVAGYGLVYAGAAGALLGGMDLLKARREGTAAVSMMAGDGALVRP